MNKEGGRDIYDAEDDVGCSACLDMGEFFVIFDEQTGDGHWMECPHAGLDLALIGGCDEDE